MKVYSINCLAGENNIKYNASNFYGKSNFARIVNKSEPMFGASRREKIAKKALSVLREYIKTSTLISQKDEKWLSPLRKLFGRDKMVVNDPNNPSRLIETDTRITPEKINAENGLQTLADAIHTMLEAAFYKPCKVSLGEKTFTVHNKKIAKLLRTEYSESDFKKLMEYLNKKRVFDMSNNRHFGLVIDRERGIAKTCGASENWEMSDRSWITDIMRVGDVQKIKRPKTWTKAIGTIADYYSTQADNFKKYIANPDLYREGAPIEGIPHIFMPKTLEPDANWFNNKRLESHGLALREFCTCIMEGLAKGKEYGYKSADDVPDNVLEAMDNLSKYFKAIDYPSAPSAGNWEEIPLAGGLTSDTEVIRSALKKYRKLLYSKKYSNNPEIQKIRERIAMLDPIGEKDLAKQISNGKKRVRATYLEEVPGIRPHDSSLAFVTTSDIKLADNVHDDVSKHLEILDSLEKSLVRENGIIRYAPFKFVLKDGTAAYLPDSYLNMNYFNAIDKDGKLNLDWKQILDQFASKDCSEPNMFFARSKLSTPDKEAQWFMVSEMSTGYGKQLEKLVRNAQKENRELTPEEMALIEKIKKKQTEYLNRALARISDEHPNKIHQIKANGLDMPAVTVSEAHQYVTDINGEPKMMQGTNAPLAWALASLYKALRQEAKTIKMLG